MRVTFRGLGQQMVVKGKAPVFRSPFPGCLIIMLEQFFYYLWLNRSIDLILACGKGKTMNLWCSGQSAKERPLQFPMKCTHVSKGVEDVGITQIGGQRKDSLIPDCFR